MNERNTWRLLGRLYHDRLTSAHGERGGDGGDDDDLGPDGPKPCRMSEKKLIEQLFGREHDLREAQIVVEWLETNARDHLRDKVRMEDFEKGCCSWEATKAVLDGGTGTDKAASSRRRTLITQLDPDAPRREQQQQGRVLHDRDAEEQGRLLKSMFFLIRAGMTETAQELCAAAGQPWRAACLEGWKLFHDPNYYNDNDTRNEVSGVGGANKLPVEGNPNRDVWKRAVWKMIGDDRMGLFERALLAPLCGHLGFLLRSPLLCANWEDVLWAYSRCMVDVRVETEIRDKIPRRFAPLPQEYWDSNKTDFPTIFAAMAAAAGGGTSSSSSTRSQQPLSLFHTVQKYLILGDLLGLLRQLDAWMASSGIAAAADQDAADQEGLHDHQDQEDDLQDTAAVFLDKDHQLLAGAPDDDRADLAKTDRRFQLSRFLVHLVIVLRRIMATTQSTGEEEAADEAAGSRVLRKYALELVSRDRVQEVAWYVSQLPSVQEQVELYAGFLETIVADPDRRLAQTLAVESCLPIREIKVRTVENVLGQESSSAATGGGSGREIEEGYEEGLPDEDALVEKKIDVIAWLLYDPAQRDAAVRYTNALVRTLVARDRYDDAKRACFNLPPDTVEIVRKCCCRRQEDEEDEDDDDWEDRPDHRRSHGNDINELRAWQAYIRANDAFSEWFEHFHKGKPVKPEIRSASTAKFIEQVAHEQKLKQYQLDLERWQGAQELQSREAVERLKAVLQFPGGWLVDQLLHPEGLKQGETALSPQQLQRQSEMDYLRRLLLPKQVLVLHSVLHKTGQFRKAVQLADLVASENDRLYEVYIKDGMKELLEKIRESSLEAMAAEDGDAWGYRKGP